MIPEPLSSLVTILRADATIAGMVPADPPGGMNFVRVYAGELPEAETKLQPRPAVLVQYSGGLPELGWLQLTRPRVDVRAYGRTPLEAQTLSWACHDALKTLQRRVAAASSSGTRALIHGAIPSGGPTPLRDADGQWPMVLRSYELLVSEVAAP